MKLLSIVIIFNLWLTHYNKKINEYQDICIVNSICFLKDSTPVFIKYDTFTYLDTNGLALTKCLTETVKVVKTEISFDTLKTQYPECISDNNIIKAYQMIIDQEYKKKSPDYKKIKKWKSEGMCWK